MDQMVFHFSMLSSNGIFEDVPVRKGHPDRGGIFGGESRNVMDELVGYITALRAEDRVSPVDQQTYTYLIADFEILDPDAQSKIDSGLWRNVSAEIGPTFTNNNAEYWPCFVGVAYVDRPAVEGLKNHAAQTHSIRLITEDDMTNQTPAAPGAGPAIPVSPAAPAEGQTTQHAAPAAPAAPAPAPVSFTIAGQQVTDFAAVQAALDEVADLRAFRIETEDNAREQFVNGLIAANKFGAPQREGLLAYVKSLNTDQFAAYQKLVGDVAPIGMLANHGSTDNTPQSYAPAANGQPQPDDKKAFRIATLKGIVQTHKLSGMPSDKIEGTGSFKELKALVPDFNLASI